MAAKRTKAVAPAPIPAGVPVVPAPAPAPPIGQQLADIREWIGALVDIVGPQTFDERMKFRASQKKPPP